MLRIRAIQWKRPAFIVILLIAQVALFEAFRNDARQTFYSSSRLQLTNFSEIIKQDLNKILLEDKKYTPSVVTNYAYKYMHNTNTGTTIYNDFIEIQTDSKKVRIDISDIVHLFDSIFNKYFSIKFSNASSKAKNVFLQKEIFENVYVNYEINANYVAEVFKSIDNNLYALFISLNLILIGVYYFLKTRLLDKLNKVDSKSKKLHQLEKYKKASFKLTQILREELEQKLKCSLEIGKNTSSGDVFVLLNKKRDKVNLDALILLIQEYYYDVNFSFSQKSQKNLPLPISLASFYQLIFSLIDVQLQGLYSNREININIDSIDDEVVVSFVSRINKYFSALESASKITFSHPLMINYLQNNKALKDAGIELVQYVKKDLRQIDISISTQNKNLSRNNVWELKDFRDS